MPLPPVESVDQVIKTPEPEKGRDRVRKPGERRRDERERSSRDDRRRPTDTSAGEADEAPRADEGAEAESRGSQQPLGYGPDADLREDEPEPHIDYQA